MSNDRYGAPWSRMLVLVSILATTILLGLPLLAVGSAPPLPLGLALMVIGLPLGILLGCLAFTVRGYELASGELLIYRGLGSTRYPLDGLRSAEHDPDALRGSWRTFGNGGLFSFSGWFRNKRLGNYRAFVTDHARAVILTWGDRTIVVSPDRPEAFVAALDRRR